jgi:hypothetical protein
MSIHLNNAAFDKVEPISKEIDTLDQTKKSIKSS